VTPDEKGADAGAVARLADAGAGARLADAGAGARLADAGAGARLAALYDLDLTDEQADLDLYLALAAGSAGPVLELAAGTGRICVPLAGAGHDVTGVDRDPDMLARARAAWADATRRPGRGSLELVQADITTLELDRRFGLVLLALNSLLLLGGRDAQLAALRVMARHLAPGGQAVIDVWLPTPDDLTIYDGQTRLDWLRTDPDTAERVAKLWAGRHESAVGAATVWTFFDTWPSDGGPVNRLAREDELHFLASTELLALVEQAGMAVKAAGSDYALSPFGGDADRIVLVCGLL
jgi:SAM-dependent methyltransferase